MGNTSGRRPQSKAQRLGQLFREEGPIAYINARLEAVYQHQRRDLEACLECQEITGESCESLLQAEYNEHNESIQKLLRMRQKAKELIDAGKAVTNLSDLTSQEGQG